MKILILTQYFWPENFQINDLAKGLIEKGHSVEILTGKPNYPSGKYEKGYSFLKPFRETWNGIPIYRVPLIRRFQSRGWQLALNYLSFVFFASLVVPWIGRRKYDLVLVFEPSPILQALPAILLKKLFGTKLALWVLDLWPESLKATGAIKSPWILSAVGRVVSFIYKNCDLILASSQRFVPEIKNRAPASVPVVYFPNWADRLFEKNTSPKSPVHPNEFHIAFAGNIGKAQSMETILKAAKTLCHWPQIKWQIYGDGREKSWAETMTKEYGLENQVIFHGQKPLESMPRIFSKADALLITLKADPVFRLTVPAKLQAYMACGKPILASLDGEGAEIINQSMAGIATPCEDSDALANSVLNLSQLTSSQRATMGRNAREHYDQNFSRDMLFEKIDELLKSTAN
jgi:colanic acid biosynthesis glycosyl transferase WcaI